MTPSVARVFNVALKAVEPARPMSVSQWAAENLYLPGTVAAESGRFQPSRMPWIPPMLDAVNDPKIAEHAWLLGSQLGKSTALVAVTGYFIAQEPSPLLWVLPTQESAESFSKERLQPIIDESPAMKRILGTSKSRDSSQTISLKTFTGGFVAITGSNSPSELRRRSVRVVIQDELDSFADSAGVEGDPSVLADKRALTFSNAVLLKASTPTIAGSSRIQAKLDQSDYQQFFVPCPKCGVYETLKVEQIVYESIERMHEARLKCLHCHELLSDVDRLQMIGAGQWRPTKPFKGIRGYQLSGMYRVIGLRPSHSSYLHAFAEEIEMSKLSEEALIVHTNTFKAECYQPRMEKIESTTVLDRCEDYKGIPNKVVLLTAGADVQANRIEATLYGWGASEESWAIEHVVLHGDVLKAKVWQDLDAWINKARKRNDGTPLKITGTCIDSGYATRQAYAFVRGKQPKGVFAIKGKSGPGLPVASIRKKQGLERVSVYIVGVDAVKGLIYSRLNQEDKGPGFIHFNDTFDARYFDQLTAEAIVETIVSGKVRREWQKIRDRNEALDTAVYAYAALHIVTNGDPSRRLRHLVESMPVKDTTDATPDEPEVEQAAPKEPTLTDQRKGKRKFRVIQPGIGKWGK